MTWNEVMDRVDKCLSEEIEEINEIERENENSRLMSLPAIPGKSLLVQGIEVTFGELAGHIGEGGALISDIYEEWEKNKEFHKKLNDAQQRGCKCVQDATN